MPKGYKIIYPHPSDPEAKYDERKARRGIEDFYWRKHLERQEHARSLLAEAPDMTIQEALKAALGPVSASVLCSARGLTSSNLRSILKPDLEAGRVGSSNWRPLFSASLRGDTYYFWLGD